MRKNLLRTSLSAIVLFATIAAQAQKPDSVLLAVQYSAMRRIDTTQLDFKDTRPKMLVVSQKQSFYTDYYSYMIDEGTPVQVDIGDGRKSTMGGTNSGGVLKNFASNTMQILEDFGRSYYAIQSGTPTFDWVIGKETKTVQDFKCQSATLDYKGRRYTAWFSDQLPYPVGPWKFGGLPGLILEMYDDKDEVRWTCTKVETGKGFKPLHTEDIIQSADEASIKKLKDALEKDRAAMKGASVTAPTGMISAGTISARSVGGNGAPPRKQIKDNNPIEKN